MKLTTSGCVAHTQPKPRIGNSVQISVAACGVGTTVAGPAVGSSRVGVAASGVAVGGMGVAVGGTGVAVGGTCVAVGTTGVAVGKIGVAVAASGVTLGATGVAVTLGDNGIGVGVGVSLHAVVMTSTASKSISSDLARSTPICWSSSLAYDNTAGTQNQGVASSVYDPPAFQSIQPTAPASAAARRCSSSSLMPYGMARD